MELKGFLITIDGPRIFLKILTENNASEEYCRWLNDAEVNQYLETKNITLDDIKRYIKDKLEQDNCLFFGIYWKENGQHIGTIKLEPIDFEASTAIMGIMIGDKNYWGRGIGTEAINLLTDYAFNELKLKEIKLGVISVNQKAKHLYEKCGFEIYNIDKAALNHDGALYDNILMRKINLNNL